MCDITPMARLSLLKTIVRIAGGLSVLMLPAACARPITTKVTRFSAWTAAAAGGTFSFATAADQANDLEQSTYESYVGPELQKLGLRPAAAGQVDRTQVNVMADNRIKEKIYGEAVYQDAYV